MTDYWYHARETDNFSFDQDRPAFFSADCEDLSLWTGKDGYVATAVLDVTNPVDDLELRKIALDIGLEDVFSEDFEDFRSPKPIQIYSHSSG